MGSPGPATISLTAAGSAYGVRRSLAYLVGIIAGTTIVLVAVATGITATLVIDPALRTALIVISALYILWLAYHIATAPPLAAHVLATRAPSLVGGTVLNLVTGSGFEVGGAGLLGSILGALLVLFVWRRMGPARAT